VGGGGRENCNFTKGMAREHYGGDQVLRRANGRFNPDGFFRPGGLFFGFREKKPFFFLFHSTPGGPQRDKKKLYSPNSGGEQKTPNRAFTPFRGGLSGGAVAPLKGGLPLALEGKTVNFKTIAIPYIGVNDSLLRGDHLPAPPEKGGRWGHQGGNKNDKKGN